MSLDLKIHPELEGLLGSLDKKELEELEKSIEEEGVRDSIVVWDNFIIDGHNRYKIAKRLEKPFIIQRRTFKDIEHVKHWMYRNQLARRNISAERREYFLGQLYLQAKEDRGPKAAVGARERLSDVVAKENEVSPATVKRAAEFAKGVDIIAKVKGPDAKHEVLSGKSEFSKPAIRAIGKEAGKDEKAVSSSRNLSDLINRVVGQTKAPEVKAEPETKTYDVCFTKPDFETGLSPDRPPLKKVGALYMHVDDPFLPQALSAIKSWGLDYQGTWIVRNETREPGIYTMIEHSFIILATKEDPEGPSDKDVRGSMFGIYNEDKIRELIETNHKTATKLDMRKFGQFRGWDKL